MKPEIDTRAHRLFAAFLEIQRQRNERMSLKRLGQLVAETRGRKRPYGASTAQAWFDEPSSADGEITGVIAEMAGWDPGWMYYGARSAAPMPPVYQLAPAPSDGEGRGAGKR